uniref:Eukaryotic translation initiation factor 4E n=1 Tax=viral metagenome TaxID=1070528 RepID=A0A6C0JM87_9ZZZZ
MDTVSISTQQHSLLGKWNLYYHLPQDKNWELSGYTIIMNDINTVEKVISLNEILHENIVKNCMLFVMREGITPMWEDPHNRNGGCFSYKVINKSVPEVWKNLFYLLCGESLCENSEQMKHVNGITISPKKNFCIIKIWLDTACYQDAGIIVSIPNLSKQGCIFKKHEPEF